MKGKIEFVIHPMKDGDVVRGKELLDRAVEILCSRMNEKGFKTDQTGSGTYVGEEQMPWEIKEEYGGYGVDITISTLPSGSEEKELQNYRVLAKMYEGNQYLNVGKIFVDLLDIMREVMVEGDLFLYRNEIGIILPTTLKLEHGSSDHAISIEG